MTELTPDEIQNLAPGSTPVAAPWSDFDNAASSGGQSRLCPECRQGKTINCTGEYLDGDDALRTCATQMAPPATAEESRPAPLATFLAEHAYKPSGLRGVSSCACGEKFGGMPHLHRAHVAELLAAIVADQVQEAEARALTQAADEVAEVERIGKVPVRDLTTSEALLFAESLLNDISLARGQRLIVDDWLRARAARARTDLLPAWTACDGRPCQFCADQTPEIGLTP